MDKPAPVDHPIHALLAARWSPRAFASRAVDPAQLQRLFEAARWAPSSYNEQPWAFVAAAADDAPGFARVLECLIEFNRSWASSAPVLLIALAHRVLSGSGKENPHAWHDVGAAVAHLTFQATSEGLAVHQMAGILPDRVRELFAIPPDWTPVSAIAIGYPGNPDLLPEKLRERELAPRIRKPQSQFVIRNRWGEEGAGG